MHGDTIQGGRYKIGDSLGEKNEFIVRLFECLELYCPIK